MFRWIRALFGRQQPTSAAAHVDYPASGESVSAEFLYYFSIEKGPQTVSGKDEKSDRPASRGQLPRVAITPTETKSELRGIFSASNPQLPGYVEQPALGDHLFPTRRTGTRF